MPSQNQEAAIEAFRHHIVEIGAFAQSAGLDAVAEKKLSEASGIPIEGHASSRREAEERITEVVAHLLDVSELIAEHQWDQLLSDEQPVDPIV